MAGDTSYGYGTFHVIGTRFFKRIGSLLVTILIRFVLIFINLEMCFIFIF